jgi:hypothetical protein
MKRTVFLAEVERRHVFRVAAVYVLVGWLLIQVAATTRPGYLGPVRR